MIETQGDFATYERAERDILDFPGGLHIDDAFEPLRDF